MTKKRRDPYNLRRHQKLGSHYEILDLLGRGWEGEVYKVREVRTNIIRAAKIFYPPPRGQKNPLLKYALKLNKLRSCPILIQYHHRDSDMINGRSAEFLISDYADGELLANYLKRQRGGRLLPFEALHLIYAITIGIEQIHLAGEYHGDIHSENILVKKRGLGYDVNLIDFYDLGRPGRDKISSDVIDLVSLLYEIIGGRKHYAKTDGAIKSIILGRKRALIEQNFPNAGILRLALENIIWD